ncbi:MAG: hypothetical protein KIT31_14745, partial [Deltaproteobacteria bacterium]|nr:hypothetical protein [Deltaproteobacteria bacterium]
MRRVLPLLLVLVLARPAAAHVGSPDIFFEGDAGPYHLVVTIRTPDVIPGIATIELRAGAGVTGVTVVPLRLTGPGSELPPSPDAADRSRDDPQFFTASLWLMEHGSLQVRIAVDGARGQGALAIPVPAAAQRTQDMDRALGALLFALMALLAVAVVSIFAAAVREAALPPGAEAGARGRRRARIAALAVGTGVVGVLALGKWWWDAEARAYERMVAVPWVIEPRVAGCTLLLPPLGADILPDHGHDLHLFAVRVPELDRLAHLHPERTGDGMAVALPPLPAGSYAVFADVVLGNGFPITGTGAVELPDLAACAAPPAAADDAWWAGAAVGET